ncbi:MAG: SpoIID/LytB domain-containing protein [Acidobacteriota bacterium]|nr:SpoIID/LytB domain-containing protein [Acidobacteriota bacterium]
MKWSWCVPAVVAALAFGCSAPAGRAMLPPTKPSAPATIRVGIRNGNKLTIRKVPLEDYVQAAILSEFAPPSGEPAIVERMLEVQAVIGRTYALAHLGRHAAEGFDLCSTTHCQLFQPSRLTTSRWSAQSAEAVAHTAGTVLWFDGAPANALFHADCGGHTSKPDDVWGGPGSPYLVSIADSGPAADAHAAWRYDAPGSAVLAALNKDPRTRVGARLDSIQVLERDGAGRAENIAIRGTQERIVRGEALREVLAQAFGARTVKSTWFDVHGDGRTFVFEGRGFGHGVGLCQAGALARIRAGASIAAVLQRYFPGTKIITLRRASRS